MFDLIITNIYFLSFLLFFVFLYRIVLTSMLIEKKHLELYSDEMAHIAEERLLRISNIEEYLKDRFYNRTMLGYPTLLHTILNTIDSSINIKLRRYIVLIISLLFPVIYFASSTILNEDLSKTLLITTLLIANFAMFGVFIRMHSSYTGRTLADFFMFMIIYFYYLYGASGNELFLIVVLVSMVFVWFSSEFGIQAILFFSIFLSLFFGDSTFLQLSVVSFIIALVFNRKKLVAILNHKFAHWIWYCRNVSWLFTKTINTKSGISKLYVSIISNFYINKFFQFLPFLPFYFYVFFSFSLDNIALQLISVSIVISILTLTKSFAFLGPSFRYFMYPLILLYELAYSANQSMFFLLAILEISLSIVFATLVTINDIKKYKTKKINQDELLELDAIIDIIDKPGNNVICDPVRLVEMIFSRKNIKDAKFFSLWDFDFNLDNLYFIERNINIYPNINHQNLVEGFNTFVLDKRFIKNINDFLVYKKFKIIYQSERFLVVEL